MKKQTIRIDLAGQAWSVNVDNRFLSWLFHKLFKVEVFDSGSALGNEPGYVRGRVTKVTSPPEYDPTRKVRGGRVTRTMPRQLKKIKEGQESDG